MCAATFFDHLAAILDHIEVRRIAQPRANHINLVECQPIRNAFSPMTRSPIMLKVAFTREVCLLECLDIQALLLCCYAGKITVGLLMVNASLLEVHIVLLRSAMFLLVNIGVGAAL